MYLYIYPPDENLHLLVFNFSPCETELFLSLFLRYSAYTLQNFKDIRVLRELYRQVLSWCWLFEFSTSDLQDNTLLDDALLFFSCSVTNSTQNKITNMFTYSSDYK